MVTDPNGAARIYAQITEGDDSRAQKERIGRMCAVYSFKLTNWSPFSKFCTQTPSKGF